VLLQILDDGRLTDSQGHVVDFKNTVIIMTSNIGSQFLLDAADRAGAERQVMDLLRQTFRPEFLNRVDEVIMFHPLTKTDLAAIVDLQLAHVSRLLADRHLGLEVTEVAQEALIEEGYDPVYGARPLKRVIQARIQNPLAMAVLEGKYGDGDTVRVDHTAGGYEFVRVPAAAPAA
jgi:ATP-dependent Clp protease ATP-binding subunit ClpB